MNNIYTEDKTFNAVDFNKDERIVGNYEGCEFINCDMSNLDLSDINFGDCTFINCDLSMVKLLNTSFRDANFENCKLLGLHFEDCNPILFSVNFASCQLDLSSLYECVLKKTVFKECSLKEVDFSACNLTASTFDNCDLNLAQFENTNLEKADFTTAYNYIIDPEMNQIEKAKFSRDGIVGLLSKHNIVIE